MTFRLTIRSSMGEARELDLDRDLVLVGKRPGVDVLLPHPDVGGVHFRLERDASTIYLVDAGIAGGTRLAGADAALVAGERHALVDGALLLVGELYQIQFQARSPVQPTSRDGTHSLAKAMIRDVLGALRAPETQPRLDVIQGPSLGKVFTLPEPGGDLIIGRGESCDAMLEDPDLSREHVRVHRTWTGATVADLGSKNGSFVGSEKLATGVERTLQSGETIALGATVLRYSDPADAFLADMLTPPAKAPVVALSPPRKRRWVYALAALLVGLALLGLILLLREL